MGDLGAHHESWAQLDGLRIDEPGGRCVLLFFPDDLQGAWWWATCILKQSGSRSGQRITPERTLLRLTDARVKVHRLQAWASLAWGSVMLLDVGRPIDELCLLLVFLWSFGKVASRRDLKRPVLNQVQLSRTVAHFKSRGHLMGNWACAWGTRNRWQHSYTLCASMDGGLSFVACCLHWSLLDGEQI